MHLVPVCNDAKSNTPCCNQQLNGSVPWEFWFFISCSCPGLKFEPINHKAAAWTFVQEWSTKLHQTTGLCPCPHVFIICFLGTHRDGRFFMLQTELILDLNPEVCSELSSTIVKTNTRITHWWTEGCKCTQQSIRSPRAHSPCWLRTQNYHSRLRRRCERPAVREKAAHAITQQMTILCWGKISSSVVPWQVGRVLDFKGVLFLSERGVSRGNNLAKLYCVSKADQCVWVTLDFLHDKWPTSQTHFSTFVTRQNGRMDVDLTRKPQKRQFFTSPSVFFRLTFIAHTSCYTGRQAEGKSYNMETYSPPATPAVILLLDKPSHFLHCSSCRSGSLWSHAYGEVLAYSHMLAA